MIFNHFTKNLSDIYQTPTKYKHWYEPKCFFSWGQGALLRNQRLNYFGS